MATNIKLTASDGHQPGAYYAAPGVRTQAAIVVVQEIFGVNSHIRSVADDFAKEGFHAIAPALFDRVERDVELGYNPQDMQRGMGMAMKIGMENALKDVAAAIDYARAELGCAKVGVVGYCFGGSLAWLAATRLGPAAAVGYYGGRITQYLAEKPLCPVMLHFGALDQHIPLSEIDKIRAQHPELPVYMYQAGHGFNCDQRKDYDAASAKLARQRTLEFLRKYL
ncbi:MAG TPA: dienelactone hydrolase family protein [Candidatus Angelobacter sp.]|nr:dienelactone hydrolase family protein [Candidatus Angelobacter sp.]